MRRKRLARKTTSVHGRAVAVLLLRIGLAFLTASPSSSGFPAEAAVHCARLVAAALLLSGAIAGAASDDETRKIQALLAGVERMDATFVRNGKTYDAKTAAEFLRRKWKANDADVATAKDFIEKIAGKSSTSGKPYLIRFKDGREVQSGEYLRAELAKLEAPP